MNYFYHIDADLPLQWSGTSLKEAKETVTEWIQAKTQSKWR